MNVHQYLTEMRAAGYRFYVTQHPATGKRTVLTLFPETPAKAKPSSQDHILALEAWRSANVTKSQLVKAIVAADFTKPKQKEHQS